MRPVCEDFVQAAVASKNKQIHVQNEKGFNIHLGNVEYTSQKSSRSDPALYLKTALVAGGPTARNVASR